MIDLLHSVKLLALRGIRKGLLYSPHTYSFPVRIFLKMKVLTYIPITYEYMIPVCKGAQCPLRQKWQHFLSWQRLCLPGQFKFNFIMPIYTVCRYVHLTQVCWLQVKTHHSMYKRVVNPAIIIYIPISNINFIAISTIS